MPIKFTPTGTLDVQTDPLALESSMDGTNEQSGAMTRCKNLHLNNVGAASMRRGISKVLLTALDDIIGAIMYLGATRFEFCGDHIYKEGVSFYTDLSDGQWSGAVYNAYNATEPNLFASNGTERIRITDSGVNRWGIDAPIFQPVGTNKSGTTYKVAYTWCRMVESVVECESNLSPSIGLSDWSGATVTITGPSDPQANVAAIYRTLADGSTFLLESYVTGMQSYPFPATKVVNLTKSDDQLGAENPVEHDRPPLGNKIFGPNYDGILFMLLNNRVYFSAPKQPEYWSPYNYVDVSPPDDPLVAGCFYGGQVYVCSYTEIYQLQGTGVSTFFPLPMNAKTGSQSEKCFLPVKGFGIFHLGNDGIYVFSGGGDTKFTGLQFSPLFEGTAKGSMPATGQLRYAWFLYRSDKLYFCYPSTDVYGSDMIVFDMTQTRAMHHSFPTGFTAAVVNPNNNGLYCAGTDKRVWRLEEETATDDDGADINWEIQSKDFGGLRKYFPRWARYDVEFDEAVGARSAYLIVDDEIKQTHVLTKSRDNRQRLINTCTGNRVSLRISGTGPVTIHSIAAE